MLRRESLAMKDNSRFFLIPYVRLAIVLLFGTLLTAGAIFIACSEYNFSVQLKPEMVVKSSQGEMILEKIDFTAEPGDLPTQVEYDSFIARQDQLAKITATNLITVIDKGSAKDYRAVEKNVSDLPALFWIQVIVALGGIFISGWIWALKPKSLAANFFFLSGLFMGLSAFSSAVYTTRLIALPGQVFKELSMLNACSAPCFGVAMLALFLVYPREVRHWKKLMAIGSALIFAWTFACTQPWGFQMADINYIILVMMVFLVIAIVYQFVMTKKDPKSRAILLWLGLSVLIGTGTFITLSTLPVLLGLKPLEQGYAFLSFLIIYVGIALGLRQYRLFEVGDWAYRFLFYSVGTALFLAVDALLIISVGMRRAQAMGLSLIVVGLAYLPLRDYFWRLFNRRKELMPHELLSEALHVTLAPSKAIRLQRWEGLIKKLFDPLEMSYCESNSKNVLLESDGVTLMLPAVADIPAIRASYPWAGRSLFSLRTVDAAKQIIKFIEEAESSRQAYDRGVIEERLRIAQDLHDDVGARLLTGLHGGADLRSTIQGAMADIRSIVKGIAGEKVLLGELLADLRSESYKRLEAAGIELKWHVPEMDIYEFAIDYHLHKTLGSLVREVVSNTIKHAKAKEIEITLNVVNDQIEIYVFDDGHGFPEKVIQGETGFGLKGMKKRVTDFGGKFEIKNSPYASISINLPMIQ